MLSTVKQWIVKMACSPMVGRTLQGVTRGNVRSRGARFDVSTWEPHLAAAVVFRMYERAEVLFAQKYLGGSPRVLELGGSRGVVSSSLLQVLPQHAELVSVEANPTLIDELRRNISRNAAGRSVTVIHAAIGDGEKLLFDTSRGSLGSALSSDKGVEVPMTTLADLVAEQTWGDYSLISDVEGAEVGFVLGDQDGLRGCSRLVLEMHRTEWRGRSVTPTDLVGELTSRHGFRLVERHRDVGVFLR